MKLYRKFLRLWLSVASLLGFVFGWVFISNTAEQDKTITTSTGQTIIINMPPIPSVDSMVAQTDNTGSVQTFTFNQTTQAQTSVTPRMRTGGS